MTDLCTLADVAAELGVEVDPTDRRLLNSIAHATGIVRNYTGQVFDLTVEEKIVVNGTGTRHVQLPQVPVLEAKDVKLYNDDDSDITPSGLHTRLHNSAGLLHRMDGEWPEGTMNVEVVYSHGFIMPDSTYAGALDAMPLDPLIRTHTASIAAALYALQAGQGVASESLGSYSVTYKDAPSLASHLDALARYRVVDAA